MKTYIYKIIWIIGCIMLTISCGNKHTHDHQDDTHFHEEDDMVELSKEQQEMMGLVTGKAEEKEISEIIKVRGMLDVPPQNLISISTPMGGFVKNTELLQGMKIRKGQVIAVMQHPDYIQIQQDYLESKTQLEYLRSEYERQQSLANDKVSSQKLLQQAKTQFESVEIKEAALRTKLQLLGINTDNLNIHNIQKNINIVSPISGYVTVVNVNIGMYVNPTDVMFKIVDTEHLHAELTVFEKDISKIKINQRIWFTLANETKERTGTVHLIGREIDTDRTVRVHCHLDKEDIDLLPGMYLKAYIETDPKKVISVSDEAVVEFEGDWFIFLTTNHPHKFKMIKVNKGLSDNGSTAIESDALSDTHTEIVIKGAYDLLAKKKNSEEGGGHAH